MTMNMPWKMSHDYEFVVVNFYKLQNLVLVVVLKS